ncbi:MAG: hypothetical protein RI841_07515 [Halomonas sp.]|uniref:hypothetical protein n=1 Tax=Halomonas sp. TaxID=1486246 RepID=UPI002870A203|nr:hypothetical protein [Halomonas sp.]MDR9439329.1 hypothetical protein [Halomonas sp.]
MNASRILEQIMNQAGGSRQGSGQSGGGLDVQGMIDSLSSQLGGGRGAPGSGVDVKSLLGGGALGLLVGSKRGRKLGGALGLDDGMRQELERQVLGA